MKQREPVPARKGRTRVDVPAIADPLHLVHHEVPVHQCPKPRDRPAAVAANLLLRRIGANAPAHRLFERVSVRRVVDDESFELRSPSARELPAARAYADYAVHVDAGDLPSGVDVVYRI